MNTELQATTEPGRQFIALAEQHAADFATRADQHDRDGSFPFENIEALQQSGFLAGPVPASLGGMGVESPRDIMVGMSRLARGCASTAIAANMHIAFVAAGARIWNHRAKDETGMAAAAEVLLRGVAARQVIGCGPATEHGTDLTAPMTELTPKGDGYVLNGRKSFGTLSPSANVMFSTARLRGDDGTYSSTLVILPKATPGVQVIENWDAMGMRASGSHDVMFTDVVVPAASILPPTPWGVVDGRSADMTASINASLAACFLGIAETARDIAVENVTSRKKGPRGKRLAERIPIQELIAEIEIDLEAARAIVDRTGSIADTYHGQYAPGQAPDEEALAFYKQQQIMKWVVQRNAIHVVDNALTVSGGAGYMSKHPLSRLYRDVRAGPFMQPFAPYEALEFIGKITLGESPQIDR
jgi:alkylation response protein AidB-like acyl-CoA dehydrogenase